MKKIQPTILEKLDKSEWNKVKFDVIAEHITEKAQPTPEDSEKYIGLEHLDSGSVHIRRWGTPIRLKGEKLKMQKGDIIFGKRNAYLKRASIAPFDGICSAHAMILRAKPDLIDPSFFPFFLNSACFMNRAIAISVGSLSPTINWKTLAKEEFRIPPMEMQKKLAELLWAVDKTQENKRESFEQCKVLREAILNNLLSPEHKDNNNHYVRLGDYVEHIQYGYTASASRKDSGVKFLRITDIQDNKVDWDSVPYCDCDDIEKYKLENGDIVFARTGATTGKSYFIENPPKSIFASYLIRVRLSDQFIPEFVYLFFQTQDYWRQIFSLTTGSAQGGFNASKLANLKIVCPSIEKQKEIIGKLSEINKVIARFETSLNRDRKMKFSLINSIF